MKGRYAVPALVACLIVSLLSGDLRLDRPLPAGGSDLMIQYDDGTAMWLTWTGLYRMVWFDIDDFAPGQYANQVFSSEFWFYHGPTCQWDTSSFLAELYSGDESGPAIQHDQTSTLALHYSPVTVSYGSGGIFLMTPDFFLIDNTEMSCGGWPSLMGDNSPADVCHSFHSDDFIKWDPWIVGGSSAHDYIIRAQVAIFGLDETTWGGIKALYYTQHRGGR